MLCTTRSPTPTQNTDMVEDGVACVHLRTKAAGRLAAETDWGCQDPDCDGGCCNQDCGEHMALLDTVDPTCLTLGYDRYLRGLRQDEKRATMRLPWATPIRV